MMHVTKKSAAALLAISMLLGNISFTYAINLGNPNTAPQTQSIKGQKLGKLSKQLQTYVDKDLAKKINGIKNVKDRQAFKQELTNLKDNLGGFYDSMPYGTDKKSSLYLEQIKTEAKDYINLRKEVASYLSGSESPFTLDVADVTKIENDMIDIQKEVVSKIREQIESYSGSSLKETGKADFSITADFGKIDVSLERYTSIMAILTRSQELDLLIKINFELNVPGPSTYVNNKVIPGKTVNIKGSLSFDTNIKMIDKDLYISLKDYSISVTSSQKDASMDAQLAQAKQYLDQYRGKTVHIALPAKEAGMNNQAAALEKMKKTMDILETQSLITPFKKSGTVFSLKPKAETLKAVAAIYEDNAPTVAEIEKNLKDFEKDPLKYESDGTSIKLSNVLNDNSGIVSSMLTKKDGKYSFKMNMKTTGSDLDNLDLLIEKDLVKLAATSLKAKADLLWENKNLSFNLVSSDKTLKINGPLSSEKTDLTVNYDTKQIATVKAEKSGDKYSYDLYLKFDIPQGSMGSDLTKAVIFKLNGESGIERGNFKVDKPSSFIEMKK